MPINELNVEQVNAITRLEKLFIKGKISIEKYGALLAGIIAKERLVKDIIMIQIHSVKNKHFLKTMTNANLISEGEAFGDVDNELEMVRCLLEDKKIIQRCDCLELSGDKKNYDVCKECDNYGLTRQLLLPE